MATTLITGGTVVSSTGRAAAEAFFRKRPTRQRTAEVRVVGGAAAEALADHAPAVQHDNLALGKDLVLLGEVGDGHQLVGGQGGVAVELELGQAVKVGGFDGGNCNHGTKLKCNLWVSMASQS